MTKNKVQNNNRKLNKYASIIRKLLAKLPIFRILYPKTKWKQLIRLVTALRLLEITAGTQPILVIRRIPLKCQRTSKLTNSSYQACLPKKPLPHAPKPPADPRSREAL